MRTIYGRDQTELAVILELGDYAQDNDKRFFTDPGDTVQVGSLFFKGGSEVDAHIHKPIESLGNPMEVLLVVYGIVVTDIYGVDKRFVERCVLKNGDILIQKAGGHGFSFPNGATVLEIKRGPYHGKKSDKEMI